jgi:hypothetical protein
MIRKTTGKELIKEFENIYCSIKILENLRHRNQENMKFYSDLDDWKYYLKHPDEEIEAFKTVITDEIDLGKS